MILRTGAVLTLFLVTLASCSDRPVGVLRPTPQAIGGASRVDMLVATTRQALPDSTGEMFSGERAREVAFADIGISIPPDSARKIGEVQWPARLPANPAVEFTTLRADRIDLGEARRRFHQRLTQPGIDGRALVFVHGFNNRFEDAVMRFAQIAHDSRAPAVPLLFTWPSRGKLIAYTYDRESGNYSRDALSRLLEALCADPAVKEIGILSHSMGNAVTMEALRTMALRSGRVNPKIKSIMLAAPDVDVDVFRSQMAVLGPNHPEMTLFVSQDDKALGLSSFVWGDIPRLGSLDPNKEPFRTDLAQENIKVIDLTQIKAGDSLAHGKFAESPEIVRFIGQRLAQGQVVTDQRIGFSEAFVYGASQTGSAFGTLAGRIVSAPISVIDGSAR